jgi:peptidyl-tRNA hydrolase
MQISVSKDERESAVRDWGVEDGPFKLVLVVNQDLKMGKGKVIDIVIHICTAIILIYMMCTYRLSDHVVAPYWYNGSIKHFHVSQQNLYSWYSLYFCAAHL